MSRKKPRFVPPPETPVPGWLLKYEERAKAVGYAAARHQVSISEGRKWWLNVLPQAAVPSSLSFFGEFEVIVSISSGTNESPRRVTERAHMLVEVLALIAPEILEHWDQRDQSAREERERLFEDLINTSAQLNA